MEMMEIQSGTEVLNQSKVLFTALFSFLLNGRTEMKRAKKRYWYMFKDMF